MSPNSPTRTNFEWSPAVHEPQVEEPVRDGCHPGAPAFDMDKELARQSRRKLLDQAAADRLPVAAYHWGFPNVGYVKQVGNGFELIRMAFPA